MNEKEQKIQKKILNLLNDLSSQRYEYVKLKNIFHNEGDLEEFDHYKSLCDSYQNAIQSLQRLLVK